MLLLPFFHHNKLGVSREGYLRQPKNTERARKTKRHGGEKKKKTTEQD